MPWGSSALPALPLPVPARGCSCGSFPVPPLSFSANFFTGSGCRPQPLPACTRLLKKWLFRQDPGLGFAGMGCQGPFSGFAPAAPGCSGSLACPGTGARLFALGKSALGTRVSGWAVLGCACCMRLGVPPPPRRQWPEASALRLGVPVLAAVPGSLAAGVCRGCISSLCSRSNCSDGDLGQLPSLSRHGNESRRLKDKWLIKKQCCIAGFFIPPTAASAEAAPLALALPSPGEGAVRQLVPVPKLIMCLITCPSHRTACPQPPRTWSGAAALDSSPGTPWVWCLGSTCARQGGTCRGRAEPGEMPPGIGVPGPPSPGLLGCRTALPGSMMLPAPLGGLGKPFSLCSHLQFFSWYLSFLTF